MGGTDERWMRRPLNFFGSLRNLESSASELKPKVWKVWNFDFWAENVIVPHVMLIFRNKLILVSLFSQHPKFYHFMWNYMCHQFWFLTLPYIVLIKFWITLMKKTYWVEIIVELSGRTPILEIAIFERFQNFSLSTCAFQECLVIRFFNLASYVFYTLQQVFR